MSSLRGDEKGKWPQLEASLNRGQDNLKQRHFQYHPSRQEVPTSAFNYIGRPSFDVHDSNYRPSTLASTQEFDYPLSTRRGRGPKNYQRCDELIAEEIHHQLTFAPDIDASEVEVEVNKGVVSLRGKMSSRKAKRRAEEVVEEVRGVREVINEIEAPFPLVYPYPIV